ncbi:aminotransferase class V-fold PLP-dependent enzyme, partial [Candidatus Bathyarchaeota archaeon]|nr:aminotransferase class V-fold PLP-dependent enzyme [Candidatus Bathyarchaeota archaeon]
MNLDSEVNKFRDDFPAVKREHYFNTCASGPAMIPVWNAVKEYWEGRLNGVRQKSPDTRSEAAKLIHASNEEIWWTCRASDSFNIVQTMFDLPKGSNVIVTDLGYPSTVFGWLPYRNKGVEIRRIKNSFGNITCSDFDDAVDDNTKVVSISHTEWTNGLTYDLKELAKIAHEHGAIIVIDAYQSLGALDIDAPKTGVDFLFSGSGKWLCCHTGAGIF